MNRIGGLLILFGFAIATGLPANAETITVEVTGIYERNPEFGESFGSLDARLPMTVTLVIDEPKTFYLPVGTPLIDGQRVNTEMLAVPMEAVIRASAEIGDIRWDETHLLRALPRSDLGFRPAVLLMGDLKSEAATAYFLFRQENVGRLSVNHTRCDDEGCRIADGGAATDERTGSWGKYSDLTISVRSAQGEN